MVKTNIAELLISNEKLKDILKITMTYFSNNWARWVQFGRFFVKWTAHYSGIMIHICE